MNRHAATATRLTVLSLAALCAVGPFAWMLLASVKGAGELVSFPPTLLPEQWRFDNYLEVFRRSDFSRYFMNSVFVTVTAVIGQVVTSLMAGYAFARLRFPGRSIIFGVFLAALLVPFELVFAPLVDLLASLGWLNTYTGMIVPNIPSVIGVFLFRQFFLGAPAEIEEAAILDGAGVWQRLFYVMAPLAAPMIGAFTILSFVYNWNNYFFQLVVVTRSDLFTVQVGLTMFRTAESASSFHLLMAASTLAVVPVILVYLLLQRHVIAAVSFSLR